MQSVDSNKFPSLEYGIMEFEENRPKIIEWM